MWITGVKTIRGARFDVKVKRYYETDKEERMLSVMPWRTISL